VTDDVDIPTAAGPDGSATAPPAPSVIDAPPGALPVAGNGSGGSDGADGSGGDQGDGTGGDEETTGGRQKGLSRAVVEWVVLIAAAIVIAIVIKTFLFQAFYIPSASMEPTLDVGDRVLVNKLSYDLHDLHRGDIVVFAAGPNTQWHHVGIDDLVKRVIALPGETISQCQTDRVCIDGKLLDESYLPKNTITTIPNGLPSITASDGKKVLVCDTSSKAGTCKVPAGKVFVMGDNRTNSQDARANGPIKESSIVGRVFVRIWPPNRLGLL
jgi:signal peptidase I